MVLHFNVYFSIVVDISYSFGIRSYNKSGFATIIGNKVCMFRFRAFQIKKKKIIFRFVIKVRGNRNFSKRVFFFVKKIVKKFTL